MRPDGTRVRDLTAIMQALPYVMPKRYDAQNWAEENLDEDAIRDYIRAKRREGRSVTHIDRKSTRLNSSHMPKSRMPSSA